MTAHLKKTISAEGGEHRVHGARAAGVPELRPAGGRCPASASGCDESGCVGAANWPRHDPCYTAPCATCPPDTSSSALARWAWAWRARSSSAASLTTRSTPTTAWAATGSTASTPRRTSSARARQPAEYAEFPMPAGVPGLPQRRADARVLCRPTPRTSGSQKHIEFKTAVERAEPRDDGRWLIHLANGRKSESTAACWSAPGTTGTGAGPNVPGTFAGRVSALQGLPRTPSNSRQAGAGHRRGQLRLRMWPASRRAVSGASLRSLHAPGTLVLAQDALWRALGRTSSRAGCRSLGSGGGAARLLRVAVAITPATDAASATKHQLSK